MYNVAPKLIHSDIYPMATDKDPINFEEQLAELEQLVSLLEEGNLPLEQSLSLFEQGINLSKNCYSTLNAAEQKVKILIDKNGLSKLEDFHAEQGDDANI